MKKQKIIIPKTEAIAEPIEVNKAPKTRYQSIKCQTCQEQCAGHGGGTPTSNGGCFCFDGVYLECLI